MNELDAGVVERFLLGVGFERIQGAAAVLIAVLIFVIAIIFGLR